MTPHSMDASLVLTKVALTYFTKRQAFSNLNGIFYCLLSLPNDNHFLNQSLNYNIHDLLSRTLYIKTKKSNLSLFFTTTPYTVVVKHVFHILLKPFCILSIRVFIFFSSKAMAF